MNVVYFIQQILCYKQATNEFIQLQSLQFKILHTALWYILSGLVLNQYNVDKRKQKVINITYYAYCFKTKHHKI
jgi:hypothetical protein